MGAVQEAHVGRGIILLCVAELGGTPVRRLLLLGNIGPDQLLHHVLQAMTVGVGAHQFRGDLGAKNRGGIDAEIMFDDREIEAGEMEQLQPRRVGKHSLQHRRVIAAGREADEMLVAVSVGQLQQAQPVAQRIEAQRLAVDGDRPRRKDIGRQVAFVEMDGHELPVSRAPRRCHASAVTSLRFSTRAVDEIPVGT